MNWQSYEEIVQNIYKVLGQEYGVEIECWGFSCKVKGKSGVEHQIDVLTKHTDGIHTYRTAIEAKHWNKKVTKDVVTKVAYIVEDAQLNKGVIVSKRGFTPDCIEVAKYKNISLVELREMSDKDWIGRIRFLRIVINEIIPDITAFEIRTASDYEGPQIRADHYLATEVIFTFSDGSQQTAQDIIQSKINEYDWREREETQIDISFKPGTQVFIPGTATPIPCKGIYFTVKRKKRLWSESKYDWGDQVAMIMKNLFEGSNLLIMKNGSIKKLY
jgi:hypothetical protein